jgi:hypothetical protein
MNNIRKQIIEILEPYMDKTLSEGCYVTLISYSGLTLERIDSMIYKLWDWFQWDFLYKGTERDCEDLYVNFYQYTWYQETDEKPSETIDKILWHYDITAVLKYIEERTTKYFEICEWHFVLQWDYWIWSVDWSFPNKPIKLYTEQEEKDLLELLKKLWTT